MILFCPVTTNTPDATTAPAIGAVLPQTPKPISITAMTRMPPMVGNLVDRGSESYQVPSVAAARTAICLLAIVNLVLERSFPHEAGGEAGRSPGPPGMFGGLRPVMTGMISS